MMLNRTPTENDLSRLYYELGCHGASAVGRKSSWPYHPRCLEELFCLACDFSRHDPRLITILVRFLASKTKVLNPSLVRSFFSRMSTPETIAVIAEFVLRYAGLDEEGVYLLEYLQRGRQPVPLQYYYHHLYLPGGHLAERAQIRPLEEYKRWGFLATEAPVLDEKSRRPMGKLDAVARHNVLKELMKGRTNITLSDYLIACGGCVSRQQALIDLKSSGFLKATGHGRGAGWVLSVPAPIFS